MRWIDLCFLYPPLKFRTPRFPQYDFKQEFHRDLHRPLGA